MAVVHPFTVYDVTGPAPVPLLGAAASFVRTSWDAWDGTSRPAINVSEVGGGVYQAEPSDADELAGTVTLIDTGVGHEPRYYLVGAYRQHNQFMMALLVNDDGTLWAGMSGGTISAWTGPGAIPPLVQIATGVFVVRPSAADIEADALGLLEAPAGAYPEVIAIGIDAVAFTTTVLVPVAPPAAASPSAEAPVTAGGARVPYQRYQTQLAPPWLQGPTGASWLRGVGDAKDELEFRTREAVKARFPSHAPKDALARLGADRALDKGVTETEAQYRARLRDAWSLWPWAGTFTGMLRALALAGYTGVYIVGGTGRYATLDGGGNLVVGDGAPLSIGTSPLWNAIRLVFPTVPAGWIPTLPGEFSDEVNNIRRIVMKWKSAVALFEGITVIQSGRTWGFPLTMTWGQPGLTWGGSVITSWAGAN